MSWLKSKILVKVISFMLGVIIILSAFPILSLAESTAIIHEHKDVNVALGKPVYCGNPVNSEKAKILTDGSTSSFINPSASVTGAYSGTVPLPSGQTVNAATGQGNDWFIVDLGKRYVINKVKLIGRDASHYRFMQYFNIEASNYENFSEYVKLGGRGSTTVAVANYETAGDGGAYRYVRIRKTGSSEYGYREIEVYADIATEEVSRGAAAEVNIQTYSNMGADFTTDGILNDGSKCWLVEGAPALPYNLVVDLGKEYPVGLIEMFGRYNIDVADYRKNWAVYGYTEAQGKPSLDISDYSEGMNLIKFTSAYPQVTQAENPEGYREITKSDTNVRYLVFAKTEAQLAAIGEIRAEVVLPEVINTVKENQALVKVSFDSKIDAETLTADNIYVKDLSGNIYTPESVTIADSESWDGGYDASLTFAENLPTGLLTLVVGKDVKTIDGKAFSRKVNVYIENPVIEINKAYKALKTNVNVALGKKVYSGRVGAAGNLLTNGVSNNDFLGSNTSDYPATAPDILLPSGDTVKGATGRENDWYIVDLGKQYKATGVRLYYSTKNGSSLTRYINYMKILASNSITFDESETLGTIGGTVPASVTSSNPYFEIKLDGKKAYRYIKIQKTHQTEYGYKELEVFADSMTTEVSRKASVEATKYNSSFAPSQAVDGTISGSNGWGVTSAPGSTYVPNNMIIDLGKDYPLGMVEVFGRKGYNTVYARYLAGFGYSEAAGKPALSGTPANPTGSLFTVGSKGFGDSGERFSVDTANYRYLVISKTTNEVVWLSEVRALVENPMVNNVTISDNNKITISFTDRMEPATLNENNFTIDGIELSNPTFETDWNGGYDVTFDYSGEIVSGMVLVVSDNVRNEYGIEMAADESIVLEYNPFTVTCGGEEVNEITAGASHNVKATVTSQSEKTAVLYVAVKDADDNLISCKKSEETVIAAGEIVEITVEGIVPKTGEKICIYLWEDETLKPIVVDSVVE